MGFTLMARTTAPLTDTACRSGEVIDWQRLLQPKVEIELALLLSADLPTGEISKDDEAGIVSVEEKKRSSANINVDFTIAVDLGLGT